MESKIKLKNELNFWLFFFVASLIISGLTAFPIETLLACVISSNISLPFEMQQWINEIYIAISNTNYAYPYLSYGTDWLGFAHVVIAIAFYGVWKDPIKNKWIIEFGMIACVLIIPMAIIAGSVRQIPLFWRLIDCSFGIIGILPLWRCKNLISKLEDLELN